MPAISQSYQYVDLSLTYDAITIYPKIPSKSIKNLQNALQSCYELDLVDASERVATASDLLNTFEGIKRDSNFQRSIAHNDADHPLYHLDILKKTNTHYHIKFRCGLKHEHVENILEILLQNHLIDDTERTHFLQQLTNRYETELNLLDSKLIGDKKHDLHTITSFIANCKDNDILSMIHSYLLTEQFTYLRNKNNKSFLFKWQGCDGDDNITGVTKTWAMIEKAISLQMALNVLMPTRYSPNVANERAEQLANDHKFFAIKRKINNQMFSKVYESFKNCNESAFDMSYDKHFRRFSL